MNLYPVEGVLDEHFFQVASPECLDAFAKLVDPGIAEMLQNYMAAPTADSQVVAIIRDRLGEAIKRATFHLLVHERGSVRLVNQLSLETLATAHIDRDALIEEFEFILDNVQYIKARLEPNKQEDFNYFLLSVPSDYREVVSVNSLMFYQRNARPLLTGLGPIVRNRATIAIALKGLKFRKYTDSLGIGSGHYLLKEF